MYHSINSCNCSKLALFLSLSLSLFLSLSFALFLSPSSLPIPFSLLQSLDDSMVVTPSPSTEALQSQLESLKREMSSKDEVLSSLQEKLVAFEEGRVRLQQELSSMKDKLNVSEVCVIIWPNSLDY